MWSHSEPRSPAVRSAKGGGANRMRNTTTRKIRSTSPGRSYRKWAICASMPCLLALSLASCGSAPKRIEATAKNFTGPPFVNSAQIQTFGVGLGDSEPDARRSLQRAGLTWDMPIPGNPLVFARIRDQRGKLIMEIHTSPPPGGRTETWNYLFHRLWKAPRYDFTVDAIEWHEEMAAHLVGDNKLLLANAIMLPDSSLRRHLLGGDGVRTSQLEMGGQMEFVSYVYAEQGFKLSGSRGNGAWIPGTISFELVPPKK